MFTDLFNIKNIHFQEGKLTAEVSINAEHEIFKGHFPGQPILPGVCQMALVKQLVETHIGHTLSLANASQVKFMSMIDPRKNAELIVIIQLTETDGIWQTDTVISAENVTFLKSKARFKNV